MNTRFEWQFGGWLQPLPPALAWGALALAAFAGLALIVLLYRRTLRELPDVPRNLLTALRVALLLTLLLILANPSRVRRPARDEKKPERHLAVLVDRSASMDARDNRNQTRLANALKVWKQHADDAARVFGRVDYRRFSTALEKAAGLDDAAQAGAPGVETHLWTSLRDALADSPAAIVCLTDGLDTSGHGHGEALAEAQQRGVPLYFVPASNRSRPAEMLSIRDVKTPSRVLRRSKFTAAAVMEISTPRDREVPVELWSGGRMLDSASLKVRAGWNVLPWSVEVPADEPGPMPLEFRLGSSPAQEIAASTTRIVDRTKVDVLYYQGALQWGFRFLRAALDGDASFHLTGILNPALGVRLNVASATQATLPDLPDDARELKRFQIVVLAHAFADMLTEKQQQALIEYARGGGGVLFITPDTEATRRFSGTPLEQMLPVVFEPPSSVTRSEQAERRFQDLMRGLGGSSPEEETLFADDVMRRQEIPRLTPFKPVPGRAAARIFQAGPAMPMFSTFARVRAVKAGAEVLAVHPTEQSEPDGKPRALVAKQRFGNGFSAVVNTDLLWRWKMSLPHDSHAVETFWQQLLLSLAPAGGEGLQIVKAGSTAAVNRLASVSVAGCSGAAAPAVVAVSPSGKRETLMVASSPEGWVAPFTPASEGRWELSATDSEGNRARITLPVTAAMRTVENSSAPADFEGMLNAAQSTGGALVGRDFAFQKNTAPDVAAGPKPVTQPLWNQPWLIGLLLGVYATELITRRFFKLL